MGAYEDRLKELEKGKSKRGSTNNKNRLEAFAKNSGKGTANWGTADPKLICQVIESITAIGGAATFGLSRDQGAHSLTLLLDGNRVTLWFNGDADLDEALSTSIVTLEVMATE